MKAEVLILSSCQEDLDWILSRELAECDVTVSGYRRLEEAESLTGALTAALGRCDLVAVCAPPEAPVAAAVAAAIGSPLEPQGGIPRGAVSFPNENGPLPGFGVEKYQQILLSLPGTSGELIPMLHRRVLPWLAAKSGRGIFTRTVGVFGMGDADLARRISDLMADSNPSLTLHPRRGGEILLRITGRAGDREAAAALCEPVVQELRERLGAYVYGVDTTSLQATVVALLKEKEMKIATAESCTAGLLSGKLTEVSGASRVFECGVAAYSKEIKHEVLGVSREILDTQGAVCADVAGGMAAGVRRVGGSDIGVGITGEAGPTSGDGKPVGTVFIALADSRRVWVKELHITSGDRDTVRETAVCQALDLARRYLEALPTVMAGGQLLQEEKGAVAPRIPAAPAARKRRLLPSVLPWKGDRPGIWITKLLIWLTAAGLLAAGWLLLHAYVIAPASNDDLYTGLQQLPDREPEGYSSADFPAGMLPRFYALYEQNRDVKGWVTVPGTQINYPVVQNGARDYTRLNFLLETSEYGVPYFDDNVALVTPESFNRSFIIHGNNTGDGQMFSDLLSYTEAGFLLAHRTVEMNTLFSTGMYEVFAVLYADETEFPYRTVSFDSGEEFAAFTDGLMARSLFLTSVEPRKEDTLLLLETDPKLAQAPGVRLVVAARRMLPGDGQQDYSVARNPDPLMPAAMEEQGPSRSAHRTLPAPTTAAPTDPDDYLPEIDLPTETEPLPVTTLTETGATEVPTAPETAPAATRTEPVPTEALPTQGTLPTESAATDATRTETAAEPSATQPTEPPPADGEAWQLPESVFYSTVTVKIGSDAPFALRTREDLHYAMACIAKTEIGTSRMMMNSTEAQKAMAVAGYTYLLYDCKNGKTSSISARIDLNDPNDRKIYDAVAEVVGYKMIDTAQQDPAEMALLSMYFGSCPGATASIRHVYTADLPYLQSVESPYDTEEYIKKYRPSDSLTSTYVTTWRELKEQLDAYVSQQTRGTVTQVTAEKGEVPLFAKSFDGAGGYVVDTNLYYEYRGKTVRLRGIDIRKIVGSSRLRSHCFTVDYDPETDRMTFTVLGHGHGLGLSMYGAIGYANEAGWSWRQILNHYFSLSDTGRYRIVEPRWEE